MVTQVILIIVQPFLDHSDHTFTCTLMYSAHALTATLLLMFCVTLVVLIYPLP